MADAAARREARRKRILENSENRIQRITGKISHDDLKEKSDNDIDKTDIQPSTSELNVKCLSVNDALIERDDNNALIEDVNSEIKDWDYNTVPRVQCDGEIFKFQTVPQTLHKRNVIKNNEYKKNDTNLYERLKPTAQLDTDGIASETNGDIGTFNLSGPASPNVSLLHLILTSRMSFIVLSAIINILFVLKLNHLFGMAIMIPYFVIVLRHLYAYQNVQDSQSGSLLIAALILSNVKPELIYRVKGLMTLFNSILKDVALYIFSFVLMYSVVSQYWNNLDTLLVVTDTTDKTHLNQHSNYL